MTIVINKHEWLDRSVSWFVKLDGEYVGGELHSRNEAISQATHLAKKLGIQFNDEEHYTNEMFS